MFNTHSHRSDVQRRAFTLIELLIVMSIILLLAAVLIGTVPGIFKRARIAQTKNMFGGWATSLLSYKSTYRYYPNLGAGYNSNEDSYFTLDQEEVGQNFVRALSARDMDGRELTDEERKNLNRKGQPFCTFPSEHYLDNKPQKHKLADAFGNTNIHIVLDTDDDNILKLKNADDFRADDIGLIESTKLNARILIYTLKKDGGSSSDFEDVWHKQ
ncbi:MAG: type II secretion system GspH family protein [Puniceicoccales bacterium]|jgi:prepilin-type N-terminal cleavage/methylation domain-containing protein|nr:type II secretion system GspH family protein [Puniceicoccales bacterium]